MFTPNWKCVNWRKNIKRYLKNHPEQARVCKIRKMTQFLPIRNYMPYYTLSIMAYNMFLFFLFGVLKKQKRSRPSFMSKMLTFFRRLKGWQTAIWTKGKTEETYRFKLSNGFHYFSCNRIRVNKCQKYYIT